MSKRVRTEYANLTDLAGTGAAIPAGASVPTGRPEGGIPTGASQLNLPPSGVVLISEEFAMVTTRVFAPALDRVVSLNRAFEAAFDTPAGSDGWVPAMDLLEQPDGYVLNVDLPGVKSSDVEITIEKNVLSIEGKKEATVAAETENRPRVHAAERVFGAFKRSLRLPEFVDAEHVEATFTDGVLTITVPKAKAAQPRRVQIR